VAAAAPLAGEGRAAMSTTRAELARYLGNPAVAERNLRLLELPAPPPAGRFGGTAGEPGRESGRSYTAARGVEGPRPSSKYGNRKTPGPNGQGGTRLYDSKREARAAELLLLRKRAGEIADFFPQVALEYGQDERGRPRRTVVDFLVIHEHLPDGRFVASLLDPKGADTQHSLAKRAALRARGLDVRLT
jgi:hypothetical protein